MKNLKLLVIVPLLFSFQTSAQEFPRMNKVEFRNYEIRSDSLEYFQSKFHYEYSFDDSVNLLLDAKIYFDSMEAITGWSGHHYEYDSENKIVSSRQQKYNWDVDLWITQRTFSYLYNDDGCIESVNGQPNFLQIDSSETINTTTQDCQILTSERKYFNTLGGLRYLLITKNIYDGEKLLRSKRYSYDGGYFLYNYQQYFFDSLGKTDYINTYDYNQPDENIITSKFLYKYDLEYNPITNLLDKRKVITSKWYPSSPQDTILNNIVTTDYKYSCDGILEKEIRRTDFGSGINSRMYYISYFYEGENECFDYEKKIEMKIFPNPSDGNLTIASSLFGSGNTQIRIFDIQGRLVAERINLGRGENCEMDLGELMSGIYVVQLISNDKFVSEKIIISK